MNLFSFTKLGRTLSLTAVAVVFITFGAWAQDTAAVPFLVSVDATVRAVPDAASGLEAVEITVKAGETDTLRLPLRKTAGVAFFGAQLRAGVPAIVGNRGGTVTVNLPAQSYKNAEVLLYTVNGKRVLRQKASASNAVNNISRSNVATGVYLLSVSGTNGESVTSRLTHSGGGLNINVIFGDGSENLSAAPLTAKKAADVALKWTVTVSAKAPGYKDRVFTIQPVAGKNAMQDINVLADTGAVVKGTFTDSRDGQEYKTVKIGVQTWMAENVNYLTDSSFCYGKADSNCVKYGRLYVWSMAFAACPAGWKLPSRDEWGTLSKAAGGTGAYGAGNNTASGAGKALKSVSGWENSPFGFGGGKDIFGFSALPGGYRQKYSDKFEKMGGSDGYWWAAAEAKADVGNDYTRAYVRHMGNDANDVSELTSEKSGLHSVRCIKN